MLPDTHVCNVHDDIICCKAPQPNLYFSPISFYARFGAAKFNACQYFWLYIHYRLHKVEIIKRLGDHEGEMSIRYL